MPAPPELDDVRQFRGLEVKVTGSLDDALRRFKSLVQKSQILREYKERQSFEKPSDKKRRKKREAAERRRIAEIRSKQMASGEWDKKQKKRQNRGNRDYDE